MTLRMPPYLVPLLYLVGCALMYSLVAYPVYLAFQGSAGFRTLMFRGSLVVMFVGFILVSKTVSVGWTTMGIAGGWRAFFRQLAIGFGIGALILAVHSITLVLTEVRVPNAAHVADLASYPRWIGKSLLSGLGVGLNEELLFRGFLLGYLVQRMSRGGAIVTCSLYFAGLHFLNTAIDPSSSEANAWSGFVMVSDAFATVGERFRLDTFLALFSAGVFLSVVRVYLPLGLAYCMGLHAGWVWVIKMTRYLTEHSRSSGWSFLIGSFDGVIGYLSAAWISVLTLALLWWFKRRAALGSAISEG